MKSGAVFWQDGMGADSLCVLFSMVVDGKDGGEIVELPEGNDMRENGELEKCIYRFPL